MINKWEKIWCASCYFFLLPSSNKKRRKEKKIIGKMYFGMALLCNNNKNVEILFFTILERLSNWKVVYSQRVHSWRECNLRHSAPQISLVEGEQFSAEAFFYWCRCKNAQKWRVYIYSGKLHVNVMCIRRAFCRSRKSLTSLCIFSYFSFCC